MIHAVIFDFDGLLIDSEIISYQIYKTILEEYGIPYTVTDYTTGYSGKPEVKNVATLIQTYELPFTMEQGFAKVKEVEDLMIQRGIPLKAGAVELLSHLKNHGYKIALATSSTRNRAETIMAQHNITSYFDAFVFAEDVTLGKPNPDVFLKACEKLQEEPQHCVVLEDSESGIQAAHSARIPVICIPDLKTPSQEYMDKTLTSFSSLNEVILFLEYHAKNR